MDKRIRFFILVFIIVSIFSIFVLTLLGTAGQKYLVGSKYDSRAHRSMVSVKRGNIYDRNDKLINYSVYDGEKYIRQYNYPSLYSHLIGYVDYKYGASGLESLYNGTLQGSSQVSEWTKLLNKINNFKSGEHLKLTVDHDLQKKSMQLMGNYKGAVIITDPRNGDVLTYYSNGKFDERKLEQAISSEESVMLDRVSDGKYSPGSVYKIISAVNILNNTDNLDYDDKGSIDIGEGSVSNYGKMVYGKTDLHKALVNSLNTYFAEKGSPYTDSLIELTENINNTIQKATGGKYAFSIRKGDNEFKNAILQIGQGELTASPMAINLTTQAIYNSGYFYSPRYVDYIITNDFKFSRKQKAKKYNLSIEKWQADYIKDAMFDVVKIGTASGYGIGENCGGKTGTAQLPGKKYNYWFTGFVSGEKPMIITIVVENIDEMGYNIPVSIFKSLLEQNK